VLKRSTSGGAFTALSDAILKEGGAVYGADFDEHFNVVHKRGETAEQRDGMRFSKYVQSSLAGIYEQIQNDLEKGRIVLFTGTPCQCAGMKARFETSLFKDRLVLCDLICHSVPSAKIWADYKKLLEEENNGKLTAVQFRSKKHQWKRENSNKGFLFSINNEPNYREDNRFYDQFIKGNFIVRPSCYDCGFTDVKRASDITIADYWGIERFNEKLYDPLGVSLIMVNSEKGEALFQRAKGYLAFDKRPAEEALSQQKRLSSPGEIPEKRYEFWADYAQYGLAYVLEKYSG